MGQQILAEEGIKQFAIHRVVGFFFWNDPLFCTAEDTWTSKGKRTYCLLSRTFKFKVEFVIKLRMHKKKVKSTNSKLILKIQ